MTKKARLYGRRIDVATIGTAAPHEIDSLFELKEYGLTRKSWGLMLF